MTTVAIVIFGVLASCFAIVLELVILTLPVLSGSTAASLAPFQFGNSLTFGIFLTLLITAVIEEGSKYLFLRQYAFRFLPETLTTARRTLILGTLFGLGFASLELGLIVSSGMVTSFLPLFGIIFLHILTSLLFAFSLLYRSLRRPRIACAPFVAALVLHILYNMAIFLLA